MFHKLEMFFTGLDCRGKTWKWGRNLRDESFKDTLDEIYRLFPVLKEKKNQFAGETIWRSKTTSCSRKGFND